MDITEQLDSTHDFNGLPNLTPQDLLFSGLPDETKKQQCVYDIAGVAGLIPAPDSASPDCQILKPSQAKYFLGK